MIGPFERVWKSQFLAVYSASSRIPSLLTPVELARAGGYLRELDRERFVTRRSLLRLLLGLQLGVDPLKLAFETSPYGKPSLTGSSIHFSVSSSLDKVLIAVSDSLEVGVDVEFVDPSLPFEQMARDHFATSELFELHRESFFQAWTLKEALSKAKGLGMRMDLKSIVVLPALPDELPAAAIDVGLDYRAAVAWAP